MRTLAVLVVLVWADPVAAQTSARPASSNGRYRLLWIGAGTSEEVFHKSAKTMHAELERGGVRSVFVEQKGTAHEWQTWRRALHDFAPRLFRD